MAETATTVEILISIGLWIFVFDIKTNVVNASRACRINQSSDRSGLCCGCRRSEIH
jgi:hypothetical protein